MTNICPLCEKEFRYIDNHFCNVHGWTLEQVKEYKVKEKFDVVHAVRICSDLNYFVIKHFSCVQEGICRMFSDLDECVTRSLKSLPQNDDKDDDDDDELMISVSCFGDDDDDDDDDDDELMMN